MTSATSIHNNISVISFISFNSSSTLLGSVFLTHVSPCPISIKAQLHNKSFDSVSKMLEMCWGVWEPCSYPILTYKPFGSAQASWSFVCTQCIYELLTSSLKFPQWKKKLWPSCGKVQHLLGWGGGLAGCLNGEYFQFWCKTWRKIKHARKITIEKILNPDFWFSIAAVLMKNSYNFHHMGEKNLSTWEEANFLLLACPF